MKKSRGELPEAVPEPSTLSGDPQGEPHMELRLYTTGMTPLSSRAIVNIRRLCETHLDGHYALEIIDVMKHPEVLKQDQVIAAPTLIKRRPLPTRRFIGDMSNTAVILKGLEIAPRDPGSGRDI